MGRCAKEERSRHRELGHPLTYGASIFGALIKLFTSPPEGFDPDDFVPTLRRFDMASLGEIVRGL